MKTTTPIETTHFIESQKKKKLYYHEKYLWKKKENIGLVMKISHTKKHTQKHNISTNLLSMEEEQAKSKPMKADILGRFSLFYFFLLFIHFIC